MADFDEAVADFRSNQEVFGQDTYEHRVDSEADLLIALEALKNEVRELTQNFQKMESDIFNCESRMYDYEDDLDNING